MARGDGKPVEYDREFTDFIPKKRHAVTVQFENGVEIPGYLFIGDEDDRVQDLLNNSRDRDFLPFQDTAGELRLIARSKIMQVIDKLKKTG